MREPQDDRSRLARHHVLIVDDDPMVLESLSILLEGRYWVSTAPSAAEARQTLKETDVSLIMADDRMPEENGIDLLAWAYRHHPGVVRLLLTGYADTEKVIRAINDAHIFHYVRKPWDNTELMNLIERGLELRMSRGALERSERVYRELFHHAHVGIVRLTVDGMILEGNRSFGESLGRDPEELVDRPLGGLCRDPERWRELSEHFRDGRAVTNVEVVVDRPDGRPAHLLFSGALRPGADGADVVEATTLDLTAQRQASIESAELREQLDRVQRDAALYTLSSGLVHDIDNHLTVILNAAGYVEDAAHEGDPLAEAMADVTRAASSAGDLTHQLVLLARDGGGDMHPVDVNAVVAAVARLLRYSGEPDRRVSTDLGVGLPDVLGSAGRLSHCFLNLGLNGLEAMPERGELLFRTRRGPDREGRPSVAVEVRDTGTGMDADVRARIFDPYFTTKRGVPTGGSGLGLAMVRGIVEHHGGSVDVESSLGVGSRFTVLLPAAERPRRDVPPSPPRELRGTGTVVLADDEPGIRKQVGQIFSDGGYSVLKASTGREAVELVALHPEVSLVVLDVVMPVLGGEGAFSKIREQRADLPVLFITPHPGSQHLREALEEPRTALLRKPFTPYDLGSAVADLLSPSPP